MGLKDMLEHLVTHSHHPVTFSGDEPSALSRWLIHSGYKNIPSGGVDPYCELGGRVLSLNEIGSLSQEEVECNWMLAISDELNRFQQVNSLKRCFSAAPNKYGYCLSSVYCDQERDVIIQIIVFLPAPIRVWVNGEIVFTGSTEYFFKEEFVKCRLAKGCNTILTESPLGLDMPLLHYGFTVKLVPEEYVIRHHEKFPFMDKQFREWFHQGYQIFPEKAFFSSQEEIALTVLPRYFTGTDQEDVKISVYNAKGERLVQFDADTFRRVTFPVEASEAEGVLRIEVESARNGRICSDASVFYGDFNAICAEFLQRAKARADVNEAIHLNIQRMVETPAFFSNIHQYVSASIYRLMFWNLAHLQRFLDLPVSSEKRSEFEVFGPRLMKFTNHRFDRGFRQQSVYLPDGYDPKKSYPLVIYFNSGHPNHVYTEDLPWLHRYTCSEAVVINTVGMGWTNYVDELSVLQSWVDIAAELKIDRDRIYVIGFCSGGQRAFKTAMCLPDVFAGIASVAGAPRLHVNDPELDLLDNIGDTTVYSLTNIEDWFFNHSRHMMLFDHFKQTQTWTYRGFLHNELNSLYNSKALLERLISARRPRYPRQVHFTVIEPPFNKAYWVKAEYIVDVLAKTTIDAEIQSADRIQIRTRNLKRISLLLHRSAMQLGNRIEIRVNDFSLIVHPGEYSRVTIHINDTFIVEDSAELTREAFDQAYASIGFDEKQLGIKQTYWQPCLIVKSGMTTKQNRSMMNKLFFLLQNPLQQRGEFYRYDTCPEADLAGEVQSNYVHVIDIENHNEMQRQLLELSGIAMNGEGVMYQGIYFAGDSFVCVKCANPRNPHYVILIVAFNSVRLEAPMIDFFKTMDTNAHFYHDSVIYNDGKFTAFRNQISKDLYPLGG